MANTSRWLLFAILAVFLLVWTPLFFVSASADKDASFNLSSIIWTTVKDADSQQSAVGDSEFDENTDEGGFGSLDSMLQWAIGHSDPENLKNAAQAAENLTATELNHRQSAMTEIMESLRMPSETDLMKTAILYLQNSSSSSEDRKHALQELLELVEPIYNSNDLHKLGGLITVVEELNRTEQDLRTLAAWVLGKASQNNEIVQNQLIVLGVVPILMEMARSDSTEEALKALYALSAIIRNQPVGQESFYVLEGASLLQDLMRDESSDIRLQKKSIFLVADLAEQQKESGGVLAKYLPTKSYLKAVINLIEVEDLDIREKALMAIYSLGRSSETAHNLLRHDCDVESALNKLQAQLDKSYQSDDLADFVEDLQVLLQRVRLLFYNETTPLSGQHDH